MPKKPLRHFVVTMQASRIKQPFKSPDWIFETKPGGYRVVKVGSGLAIAPYCRSIAEHFSRLKQIKF
jgi:hypothetical protein